MLEIYMLFLLAPVVTNLGTFHSLAECQRVSAVIAQARHKPSLEDAEIFGKNRLLCVKVNDKY